MSSKLFWGSTFILVLLVFLFIKIPTIKLSYDNQFFYLKGDTFEIGWIHSVEKEPWFETYKMNDGELYLVGTRFKTFGAGTPSEGEIIPSNDGYIHMKMRRKIKEIDLVVSKNVQTALYTESGTIPLYNMLDNHEVAKIEIVNIPIWRWLLREDFR